MAVVIPRYFGSLHELNKFCVQIVGEPVIIPVDPEHDLIMIYDIVEGKSESRRTDSAMTLLMNYSNVSTI